MRREFDKKFLSLLHFDFPYYGEPGDGCRDEIKLINWERVGDIKFAGSEIPYDENFAPKFGYRCLSSTDATTYLLGTGSTEIFNIRQATNRIIEMFIYPKGDGNILVLYSGSNAVFTLKIASSKLQVIHDGNTITGSNNLTLNQWQHIAVQFSEVTLKLFVNGTEYASGAFSDSISGVTSARLGGFNGYIDEFLFSAKSSVTVPDEPYKGILKNFSMGGKGTGSIQTSINSKNNILNTWAVINSISSGDSFIINDEVTGKYGGFDTGDEVLIIVKYPKNNIFSNLGMYSFRHVKSRSGKSIILDSAVNEFPFNSALLNDYRVEIIKVPNYSRFALGAEGTIKAPDNCGLVVFRVSQTCEISGKILTHNSNANYPRIDLLQMTNADLPERFIVNCNGGVMILGSSNLTINSGARIGGDYSGLGTGGERVNNSAGNPGGSGYGGSGACGRYLRSGMGGVGGGGGGNNSGLINAFNAGSHNSTGGTGIGNDSPLLLSGGAAQGKTPGATSDDSQTTIGTGGGGTLGNSGQADSSGGFAGACVLIVCKSLQCDEEAISTGGTGGSKAKLTGGGGSGLCYIACKEMK